MGTLENIVQLLSAIASNQQNPQYAHNLFE